MLRPFMEVDDTVAANADLHGLLTRLYVAIEQQTVGDRTAEQPSHQAVIIENIGIHEHDRFAAFENVARSPERNHAALAVMRILDQSDVAREPKAVNFLGDEIRAKTDRNADIDNVESS